MNAMKKTIYVGLLGLLGQGAYGEVKGNLQQSQIISEGNKPVERSELMLSGMPLNSDAYARWERGLSGNDTYKFRLQTMPLQFGPASAGFAAENVKSDKSVNEVGVACKIAGNVDEVNLSINPQLYPKNDKVEYYGTASLGHLFADVLGQLITSNGTGYVRPGIDYVINIGDIKVGLGLETKLQGKMKGLKDDYAGLRLRVKI